MHLIRAADPSDPGADPTAEVSRAATSIWTTFVESLPRIGVALAVVLVGYVLARLLRALLRRVFTGRRTESFAKVMSKLAGYVLMTLSVLAGLTIAFPSVRPVDLLAGLGFFSIAVGFAFQDILENTLSGVLLLFRQPFASGDQIEVQGRTGTVRAITIRETRLVTYSGELVVIPNRDVYKNVIRVDTHHPQRRVEFSVGIAFENDPRQACEVVVAALAEVDGVALLPPPEALVSELGVSTVQVDVRFWCASRQHDVLARRSDAMIAVKAALDAAGIEMPADIIALQATPSLKAALQNEAEVTPGGAVRP